MSDLPPADGTLHTALITGRNGCDIYAAANAIARDAAVAAYCRTYWSDARAVNPELSKEPPTDDEEAITDYFTTLEEEHCDRGRTDLDAIPAPSVLTDDELARALQEVGELTRALSRQRANLARERIRRLAAALDISLQDAISAGLALTESLPPETRWEVEGLLNVIIISEGEHDVHTPTGSSTDREPDLRAELPSVEAIRERFMRELPRRQFTRRVRWSVRQLERIAALNEAADSEAIALHEGIAENTRRLIAARRAPDADADASPATGAQVAYLMGVEVLVDLDERRVTRVVAIDESIELDAEEGAREQDTLAPLPPAQAAEAVAIAESAREPWPATEFGF